MVRPELDPLCLDLQLCFPLYAASNLITRLYRPALAPLGLTYSQYLVMLVLWESSPQTVGTLGQRLHLDSGTLTPLLKRMERDGFVARSRDKDDERRVLIELTPDGRSLRNQAERIPATVGADVELAPEWLEALRRDVGTFVSVLSNGLRKREAARCRFPDPLQSEPLDANAT
ncbi:MarR family winged helix-turn-helix transcriptional regulator [Sphingomonas oryzagri]